MAGLRDSGCRARWDSGAAETVRTSAVLRSPMTSMGTSSCRRRRRAGAKECWCPLGVLVPSPSPPMPRVPLGMPIPGARGRQCFPTVFRGYRIAQALHPARHRGDAPIHVNLDFRVFTNSPGNSGRHRFWLGSSQGSPAVELLLEWTPWCFQTGDRVEILRSLQAGKWHNVQLDLDPGSGVVRGRVGCLRRHGVPGASMNPVGMEPSIMSEWMGACRSNHAPRIGSGQSGCAETPIPPVTVDVPRLAQEPPESDAATLMSRIQELAGVDGDFELQTAGSAPAAPWHPGPRACDDSCRGPESVPQPVSGRGSWGATSQQGRVQRMRSDPCPPVSGPGTPRFMRDSIFSVPTFPPGTAGPGDSISATAPEVRRPSGWR